MILQKLISGCILLLAASLWAADSTPLTVPAPNPARPTAWLAVLDNGFSIRHYRRVYSGSSVRFYTSPTGESFVELPSISVVKIQVDDAPIPATAADASASSKLQVSEKIANLDELVTKASDRHGIDADLIRSVIAAESSFRPGAISAKGAQGLMQLMPETASSLGVENALDPAANVDGGTRYLRDLLLLYQGDLIRALAAYNAGPEKVELYQGVPPYAETQAYVRRVIRDFNRKKLERRTSNADGRR